MSRNEPAGEPEIDPREFLKNLLHISAEDAEQVRRDSPATRKRGDKGQDGPTADYGDDNP